MHALLPKVCGTVCRNFNRCIQLQVQSVLQQGPRKAKHTTMQSFSDIESEAVDTDVSNMRAIGRVRSLAS